MYISAPSAITPQLFPFYKKRNITKLHAAEVNIIPSYLLLAHACMQACIRSYPNPPTLYMYKAIRPIS